jgi:3-hydroxyacyl-CoA dehydrogenase/enoyl-CoA hydratase/3-hydroxybutyryl-CoA epimerase
VDAFIARADQLAARYGAGFALGDAVKAAIRQHEPRW